MFSLTSRFVAALAGNASVELPVRSAAHGADLFQAAAMEEATSEEKTNMASLSLRCRIDVSQLDQMKPGKTPNHLRKYC